MSESALERLKRLEQGLEIDDEAENERLFYENPEAYHEREMDKQEHERELRIAAKRRLTKI